MRHLPFLGILALTACDTRADRDVVPDTGADRDVEPDTVADRDVVPDVVEVDPAPRIETGPTEPLPVTNATEDEAAFGFRASGRIHPAGRPTRWYIEYGPTADYGSATAPEALPARLGAHYREDWDTGLAGYLGGFQGDSLTAEDDGTRRFLRFTDKGGGENDVNHWDGVGTLHLPLYAYPGNVSSGVAEQPSLYLGGGHPDLRGAAAALSVRGNDWDARGTTLSMWLQMDLDPAPADQVPMRRANWANTGTDLAPLLATGQWERAEWTLANRLDHWTYSGQNGGRNAYLYKELDASLGDVNVDFFPAQVIGVDIFDLPSGAIDFDDFELTFRNHSVLVPSNGATLESATGDASTRPSLTDGWRFGEGHEWSAPAPGPNDARPTIRWSFERPITLTSVLIHNSLAAPTTSVDVRVSADHGATFVSLGERELPTHSALGPNFLFAFQVDYDPVTAIARRLHPEPITDFEVVLVAGPADAARWGLGEVEAYGTGALERPDDAWYDVNGDVLVAPGTWHHRLVAENDLGVVYGDDAVVVVPGYAAPVLTSVYPALMTEPEGAYLNVFGSDLRRQTSLTIGGVPFTAELVARDVFAVWIPPGHGTCEIELTTAFGEANLPAAFAFADESGAPDPGPCIFDGE